MKGQIFTVNSLKYDLSLRRSWTARLLERSEGQLVLEGFFEEEVQHRNLGVISRGTRSVERFFLDRWYNYFVFFESSSEVRNYYINISMPPHIEQGAIDYVDLDIDIIIWPNGNIDVLDMDEFEENVARFHYPESVVEKALYLTEQIATNPYEFITPVV